MSAIYVIPPLRRGFGPATIRIPTGWVVVQRGRVRPGDMVAELNDDRWFWRMPDRGMPRAVSAYACVRRPLANVSRAAARASTADHAVEHLDRFLQSVEQTGDLPDEPVSPSEEEATPADEPCPEEESPPAGPRVRRRPLLLEQVADPAEAAGDAPSAEAPPETEEFMLLGQLILAWIEREGSTLPAPHGTWWRVNRRRYQQAVLAERSRLERIRKEALALLSPEQKRALGLPMGPPTGGS